MLIIARRNGEGFQAGSDIKITILETKNGRARLGIDAPSEVIVLRDELAARHERRTGET